ncbi:hypothetical protein GIB67_042504 [Kingdonia uniflora]|uniref:CS domain-containing protein n=1 Tax=Kingdonia uniflora TaxID=39325 RepID=A0A7J7M0Z5_9MAGN|nr:hypothetical protein GIB67_042504 [Kingdonia uniflora]
MSRLCSCMGCDGLMTWMWHCLPVIMACQYVMFSDGTAEVELRLHVAGREIRSSRDILLNADENSLIIKTKSSGSITTLIEINHLYDKIKPGETIWYIDEDQLVVNLKKHDPDLKWPDIMESWESLTLGVVQILKGTSINVVGDSTTINQKVARELAIGLGYTPLNTSELLEAFGKQAIDSCEYVKPEASY